MRIAAFLLGLSLSLAPIPALAKPAGAHVPKTKKHKIKGRKAPKQSRRRSRVAAN
jgi:hypothetical protein